MFKTGSILKGLVTLFILALSTLAYSPQYSDVNNEVLLRWQQKKIPISISNSFFEKTNNIKIKSDVLDAIYKSFNKWQNIADIDFQITFVDNETVSPRDSGGDGISLITIAPTSENILLFEENINNKSAITRLFYTKEGAIKEADIVLNPISLFSTDGTFRSFDLEATLTHEIGHLLGLGHSSVIGAIMHKHQGKNGIYNLTGFNHRTLSEDDKSGLRSLYGRNSNNSDCCGKITGEIGFFNNDLLAKFTVWVEEVETGRVMAAIESDNQGNFIIEGLPKGNYLLFTRDIKNTGNTVYLGEVNLENQDHQIYNKSILFQHKNFEIEYYGINGQLSKLAIPITSGKSTVIYVSGKKLNNNNYVIGFNSPNIKAIPNSLTSHDYRKNLNVLSFEIQVEENTLPGLYSFYLEDKKGIREYFIGGMILDEMIPSIN